MKPVFIGGTGRSGTTILRKTLGRHPDVAAMPGELRLIVDSHGVLDLFDNLTDDWDPFRADRAIFEFKTLLDRLSFVSSGKWYKGHNLAKWVGRAGLEEAWARLHGQLVRYTTPGFWTGSEPGRKEIYEAGPHDPGKPWLRIRLKNFVEDLYRGRGGGTHYVEDTPYNVCHVHRLRRVFVGCHIVHVRRHPLDVLASFKMHRTRSKAWTSDSVNENARRIAGTLAKAREDMTVGSGCSWLVCLEDLVEAPQSALSELCEGLGLPWDESLLGGNLSADRAHIGRWRNDLTESEVEEALPILEPYMGDRYER